MPTSYAPLRLENMVQEYPWGSRTAIPELLGRSSPAPTPQAELWMGAHPKAPSLALTPEGPVPLPELIRRDPRGVLGPAAARRFGGELPFLFKVLAAAEPLSIQVHPGVRQARRGFRRETARGLSLEDPRRNYRDPHPKPEIICALTPFWALHGFRPPAQILELLHRAALPELRPAAARGLRALLAELLRLDGRARAALARKAAAWAAGSTPELEHHPIADWLTRLQDRYPGDLGVLGPLVFNLLRLEPGEALYLGAGVPHAYLEGVGMELMANSDNVVRGGLTSKPVDAAELMRVTRFRGGAPRRVATRVGPDGARLYPTPAREFQLAEIALRGGQPLPPRGRRAVEVLFCLEGPVTVRCPAAAPPAARALVLEHGQSLLIPWAAPPCGLSGEGRLFRASVP